MDTPFANVRLDFHKVLCAERVKKKDWKIKRNQIESFELTTNFNFWIKRNWRKRSMTMMALTKQNKTNKTGHFSPHFLSGFCFMFVLSSPLCLPQVMSSYISTADVGEEHQHAGRLLYPGHHQCLYSNVYVYSIIFQSWYVLLPFLLCQMFPSFFFHYVPPPPPSPQPFSITLKEIWFFEFFNSALISFSELRKTTTWKLNRILLYMHLNMSSTL